MVDKKIEEAVKDILENSKERKFLESVELSINLKHVDLKNPKNRINEEIILPNGRGKPIKIGIFATGELAVKSKAVADLVISLEEIGDMADNKQNSKKLVNEYSFFIAEAPLMPTIGKSLGIILGPRGKMPKPVPPNADPEPIVNNLRKTVKARSKERRTFHIPIGTREMNAEDIAENAEIVLKKIINSLERGKANIASAYIKTTMGHSAKIM